MHMTIDPSRLLLVASNRGPVSYQLGADGSLTARRGGGGMVSGLTSGLAAAAADGGVLWLCTALSDADREAARLGARADAPGEPAVRMLEIPPTVFDAAYNGIANSILWFVHHLLFDTPNQPVFDARFRRDWDAYRAYNEAFAVALAEECAGGTRVLVQDYHLALAPRMLRDRRPDARIVHFEHTPWAPPEYYRILPDDVAAAILDGMLGADHVGFLAERWAGAFLDCCEAVLGARVMRGAAGVGRVNHRGRITEVAVHPLGVDAGALRERAAAADVRAAAAALSGLTADGRQLIVRVDRTELSKNIVRGLAAYRELLAGAAGVARPGDASRVRVPVAVRAPRVPGLHGPGARAGQGDQRRVRDAGLARRSSWMSGTTILARSPPAGRPTCCWSTRSGTA